MQESVEFTFLSLLGFRKNEKDIKLPYFFSMNIFETKINMNPDSLISTITIDTSKNHQIAIEITFLYLRFYGIDIHKFK